MSLRSAGSGSWRAGSPTCGATRWPCTAKSRRCSRRAPAWSRPSSTRSGTRTSAGTARDPPQGSRAMRSRSRPDRGGRAGRRPRAGARAGPGTWLRERRGRAYDPAVVDAVVRIGDGFEAGDEWDAALACEPEPVATIAPERLDAVLTAFADFADLKSPLLRGHSRRWPSSPRRRAARPGSTPARATSCGAPASSTIWAASRWRTGSGTSPAAHDAGARADAAARLLHGADPRPLPAARGAARPGRVAPRAARRLRLPPLARRRVSVARRPDSRRRGRFAALTADRPHRDALE